LLHEKNRSNKSEIFREWRKWIKQNTSLTANTKDGWDIADTNFEQRPGGNAAWQTEIFWLLTCFLGIKSPKTWKPSETNPFHISYMESKNWKQFGGHYFIFLIFKNGFQWERHLPEIVSPISERKVFFKNLSRALFTTKITNSKSGIFRKFKYAISSPSANNICLFSSKKN
jgi:hypothetical protein